MKFSTLVFVGVLGAASAVGVAVVDFGQAGPGLNGRETQAKWHISEPGQGGVGITTARWHLNLDGQAGPALNLTRSGAAGLGKWSLQLAKSGGVGVADADMPHGTT